MNVEASECVDSGSCNCAIQNNITQACQTATKSRKGNLGLFLSIIALAVSITTLAIVFLNQYADWVLENPELASLP